MFRPRKSVPTASQSKHTPTKNTASVKDRVETFLSTAHSIPTTTPRTSRKRKRALIDDELQNPHPFVSPCGRSGSKANPISVEDEPSSKRSRRVKETAEKRQRRYRAKPPQTFLDKLFRAQTQRMIVLSRTRSPTALSEDIEVVGSTGNIYTVTVSQLPSCTCPDHQKGNECKHKVYALHTVLKAPEHLQYQLAFLTSELEEIFASAPPIPTSHSSETEGSAKGKRKAVEGECPICYMDMDAMVLSEELVWCRAACGNNMHKSCFEQWAASQRGQTVKCVYCRTPWEMDTTELSKVKGKGTVNADGYVNVAAQFGMSGRRDYSSYHQPWVRRTFGRGRYYEDDFDDW